MKTGYVRVGNREALRRGNRALAKLPSTSTAAIPSSAIVALWLFTSPEFDPTLALASVIFQPGSAS
jgi:hypothetical protein